MMPTMTGYEFRDAQVKDPDLSSMPVVVISAAGRAEEGARKLGGLEYVSKPISPGDLLQLVGRYCGGGGGEELLN